MLASYIKRRALSEGLMTGLGLHVCERGHLCILGWKDRQYLEEWRPSLEGIMLYEAQFSAVVFAMIL